MLHHYLQTRALHRWLGLALLLLSSFTQAATLLDDVVNPVGVQSVKLSPDGKNLVMIAYTGLSTGLLLGSAEFLVKNNAFNTTVLVQPTRDEVGFYIYNKEPQRVIWVTNDLLAVDYGYVTETIDLNGKKVREVGVGLLGKADPARPDSAMLLVFTDKKREKLALVDGRTGTSTSLRYPMSGEPRHFVFDSRGQLRAMTIANSAFWRDVTTISNWYKPDAEAEWEKLAEFGVNEHYWYPLAIAEQADALIISAYEGRDTRGIFLYDTKKKQAVDMMAGHPTQDIVTFKEAQERSAFDYVMTNGMLREQYWFDAEWASLQKSVDATLPQRINILSGNPKGRVLVYSYGDVDPGRWLLLDVPSQTIRDVEQMHPDIKPGQMQPMASVTYQAKDGMNIPAYLTRPKNSKGPAPAVILIHGGPYVRDHWGWNAEVQILAAHGYAVLQPQFRGSSGFGLKYEVAGYGQWGLAMQDDVTAGVEYLIRQGIADPNKICIAGSSYGGYAALWGLIKTPQLYRCGISFAGVADLEFMFNDWSDANDNKVAREIMRFRIGDSRQDKEKFDSVSPLKHADKINVPLLLMHGDKDQRVPISHMEKMTKALDKHKKKYTSHIFWDEGHGLRYVKNEKDYYEKILKFLHQHIGGSLPEVAKAESEKPAKAAPVASDPAAPKPAPAAPAP